METVERPMLIYVAGPMSQNFIGGLIDALDIGAELINYGHVVYLPQVFMLMDVRKSKTSELLPGTPAYESWMGYDFRVIDMADAVFRLSGLSHGADREVEYAKNTGKLIYHSLDAVPHVRVPEQ